MKPTKKMDKQLAELASRLFSKPNIWSASSVVAEPQKWLENWQVYKVVKADIQPELFGFHFVGFDVRGGHGAVSSKLEKFDPVKMCGVTVSGRVYQLVGLPGIDEDAQYTLHGWSARNKVVVEEATMEFVEQYKIDLKKVWKLDQDSH